MKRIHNMPRRDVLSEKNKKKEKGVESQSNISGVCEPECPLSSL